MRHRFFRLAFIAAITLSGSAFARDELLQNIPLQWTPTSTLSEMGSIDISGAMLTTKIHFDTLTDSRQNPALIAENREKADKVKPVTTSANVAAFVTDHLKETMRNAGLNMVESDADIVLSGEIRQFFVNETSNYHGEMSVVIHAKNRKGKELWVGAISGGAERFGRSYKADNYYETLSDTVMRAGYNLMSNAGFREAVQKH